MTTLTAGIAEAPDAPASLLVAILDSTSPTAKADDRVRAALAANPSLPTEHVEAIAATARTQTVRGALVSNPNTTMEQARRWLTAWPKVQLTVWRTAVSHIEDPQGHLATMALERHNGVWLYSEILTSDTTSEAARIAAAVALAGENKLKQSERDRITAVAVRTAGVAAQIRDAAVSDGTLRTAMHTLHCAQETAAHFGRTPSGKATDLEAWLAVAPDEQAALRAMGGVTSTTLWRAAARTCRPGWDAMSAAVMDFARAEYTRSWANGASVAKAVLANPGTRRTDRTEAARMVAATGRGMSYDLRKVVHRVTTTTTDRSALTATCRDTLLLAALLKSGADLTPSAKMAAVRFAVEATWANEWLRNQLITHLMLDPDLTDDVRRQLLRAHREGTDFVDTATGRTFLLELAWEQNHHLLTHSARTQLGWTVSWQALNASRGFLIGSAYTQAVEAGTGLGALADLPVRILQGVAAPVHVGGIALRVVAHATDATGGTVPGALVLRVLDSIATGFEGTLGELATVVGASMRAA